MDINVDVDEFLNDHELFRPLLILDQTDEEYAQNFYNNLKDQKYNIERITVSRNQIAWHSQEKIKRKRKKKNFSSTVSYEKHKFLPTRSMSPRKKGM